MDIHENASDAPENIVVAFYDGMTGEAIYEAAAEGVPTAAEAGYSTGKYARTDGELMGLSWDSKGLFRIS